MKIQSAILALGCISAMAQDSLTNGGNFFGTSPAALGPPPNPSPNPSLNTEYNFIPKDPWREVDGQTNYANGEGWVQFTGEIVAVKPYGIWVKGGYGKPPFNRDFYNQEGLEFFVKNYPYQSAYGDILLSSKNLTAKESGVFTFTNTTGGTTTLHKLDYGVPCSYPEWFIKQQKEQADATQTAIKAATDRALAENGFIPHDPWRKIDGQTNYAKGEGWVQFAGTILEVQPHGIRVEGWYEKPPLAYNFTDNPGTIFFVENYPYQCAEGESLSAHNLTAKESGVYTYLTAIGGTSTIRKFGYGVPCDAPEWFIKQQKEQADAAQAAANAAANAAIEAQKKKAFELQKHAVEWLLSQATNGSASAQCSLGIHYLNGQGVETNKETAFYWLTQAANQGYIEASNMLIKLK